MHKKLANALVRLEAGQEGKKGFEEVISSIVKGIDVQKRGCSEDKYEDDRDTPTNADNVKREERERESCG